MNHQFNFEIERFAFEPELDGGWQGEVNRRSSDYIKWVQRSLNQIMGLRLAVDGVVGTYTRSAIRSFQRRQGLHVDGNVGPQTERALIAAGADSGKSPKPASGGAQAPACEAAAHDLEVLHDMLKWLGNELGKQTPNPTRLGLLRDLVRLQVDDIIANLGDYIAAGCCEPSLKTLETQVNGLPWPVDNSAQGQRARLVQAIKQAQEKARKDFQHC